MKGTHLTSLRGLLLTCVLGTLVTGISAAAGSPIPITAVQVEENGTLIRLIAEGAPDSSIHRLTNPVRTVVDLTPARLALPGSGSLTLPVDSETIRQIRVGQYQQSTVRVVIDHINDFGILDPAIEADGEQVIIAFGDFTTLPALPADGTQITVAAIEEAQAAIAIPVEATTTLEELPLTIAGSATESEILFGYPGITSYAVWLERFPNRLVFETPAKGADIAPTMVRYDLDQMVSVKQGMIESLRIFTSADGTQTKIVAYLTGYAEWEDRIVDDGVSVALWTAEPPRREGTPAEIPFAVGDFTPHAIADAGTTTDASIAIDTDPAAIEPPIAQDLIGDAPIEDLGIHINETEIEIAEPATTPATSESTEPYPFMTPLPVDGAEMPQIDGGSDDSSIWMPNDDAEVLPMEDVEASDIYMFKGESLIIPTRNLARTSVGDPEVLAVNVLSQEELLITAKAPGSTTLLTWEEGKGRVNRTVHVASTYVGRAAEIERVIGDDNVKVSIVGGNTVVLEGMVATEEERVRAQLIAGGGGAEGSEVSIVNLIDILDPYQILVKVRIVEINNRDSENLLKQFGAGTRTESGDFSFNVLSDIFNPQFPNGGVFDISLRPGIVNNENVGDQIFDPLDLMLNMLETSRKARILSQPNLVVLSGHEATFRVGGEIPYTFQNENGFNVVDFREFGIELKATPLADAYGNINLAVNPTVRTVDNGLAVAGIPGFRTRTIATQVQIPDSSTLVVGGLIQREISTSKAKVPILSAIPIIGELFKSKSTLDDETELLIFLTPSILKSSSEVQDSIYTEDDVAAGGVDDERYTFYGDHAQEGIRLRDSDTMDDSELDDEEDEEDKE